MITRNFTKIGIITLLMCVFSLPVVAQQKWALVKTAVTSLRTEPRHGAEMCTQSIMGTPLRLLSKHGSWWKVELPDEYTGYLPANTIKILNQNEFDKWRESERCLITSLETTLTRDNNTISDLVCGNILSINDQGISTPDGRIGETLNDDESITFDNNNRQLFNADLIVETAMSMLGRVYLWGGTSPKMMDCSGMVKVCYLASGIILRRDASQQAKTGKTISNIKDAQKGDLLFFGTNAGKVNHVGIYIGNNKYIHCSGQIKINSLNPQDSDYTQTHLLHIKRIDGMIGSDGIWSIYDHPWYFKK